MPEYLTTKEAAALARKPVETMRYYRWCDKGPKSFKLGRTVLYERADVLAWIEAEKTKSAAGGGVPTTGAAAA
jgi:hypothetical protein